MLHLFKRMRHGFGRGKCRAGHDNLCSTCGDCLANVAEGNVVVIVCNNDHKTMERGIYTGVQVKVLRNETDEPNLVVAVGDARYVLDRRIAQRIKVI